jgi:uncharacterized protein YjiS (DUF1127 family)
MQHTSRIAQLKELPMMTQPIQMFENLTSETAPAGGNALTKIGFSHADRRLVEMQARYARAAAIADAISNGIMWVHGLYSRVSTTMKANFRLRAAEAQLLRMGDRELADLGLCRSDIPYAVRAAAEAEQVVGETPLFKSEEDPFVPANQNNGPAIFWAGRA